MPIGLGRLGTGGRPLDGPAGRAAPRGFHPGALWLAAAVPAAATILLIARFTV